jgi:hypothetical protein
MERRQMDGEHETCCGLVSLFSSSAFLCPFFSRYLVSPVNISRPHSLPLFNPPLLHSSLLFLFVHPPPSLPFLSSHPLIFLLILSTYLSFFLPSLASLFFLSLTLSPILSPFLSFFGLSPLHFFSPLSPHPPFYSLFLPLTFLNYVSFCKVGHAKCHDMT